MAMLKRLGTALKHRWLDESDVRRAIPPAMLERLQHRVAASERTHSGEIRICVEASLPGSYLWRHLWHGTAMDELARQRAVMQFGKLRVWDTENNNGVLVYLLLAEHRIELVADRALSRVVAQADWDALVGRLAGALADGRFEDGLVRALDEVSVLLARHFPLQAGQANPNELPDTPEIG